MSAVVEDAPATVLHTQPVDASPPPGVDRDRVRFGAAHVLMMIAFLLVWVVVYLLVLSPLEQAHTQGRLYSQLRAELAEGTAPTGAPIEVGEPVAVLTIKDAGVENLVVVEGSRPQQLQGGPGHVLGSVLPGQQGTSVLAGRSLSFGAPFATIDELSIGAVIRVTTAQGSFSYRVSGVRRTGDPLPGAVAAGAGRLTLLTASRGGLQAARTVYVDADLDKAVAAGPVGTPDRGDRRMSAGVDTTTLSLLALALQALVLALAGFAWSWSRWSRAGAWIALGPAVIAALWLATSLGSRLLPGLI